MFGSQSVNYLGWIEGYGLVGGGLSLGVGFGVSKAHICFSLSSSSFPSLSLPNSLFLSFSLHLSLCAYCLGIKIQALSFFSSTMPA